MRDAAYLRYAEATQEAASSSGDPLPGGEEEGVIDSWRAGQEPSPPSPEHGSPEPDNEVALEEQEGEASPPSPPPIPHLHTHQLRASDWPE